jgi:hypothetical protein
VAADNAVTSCDLHVLVYKAAEPVCVDVLGEDREVRAGGHQILEVAAVAIGQLGGPGPHGRVSGPGPLVNRSNRRGRRPARRDRYPATP